MKRLFTKRIARFVGGLLMLTMVSCNAPGNSQSPTDPENIPTIDFNEDDYVCRGSASGFLIDIGANMLLSNDNSYICSFSPSTSTDGKIKFSSSREESVTLEFKEGQAEFTLLTHKVGDSIIKLYDSNDILVYRNIVRVRKAFSEKEIVKECYNNDIYRGVKFLGNHKMTFLDDNAVPIAQLKGSDDYESNIDLSFSCTYSKYIQEIDSYEFLCEITDNPNNSQTRITILYISRTGAEIKMYYRSGGDDVLFNIFYASKYESLYPGILC